MSELSEADKKWIEEHERLLQEGDDIVDRALDEALDYLKDLIENMNDKQWRKMAMSTQTVEMGVGIAVAEKLVPIVYDKMTKRMHKKLRVSKQAAESLRHVFIGRVVKNIQKELHGRDS